MNPYHFMYNLVGTGLGAALKPAMWLRAGSGRDSRERYLQRFGHYPPALHERVQGRPRVWFHAVSVGEVGVAAAVADELRQRMPGIGMVVSTTTVQGLARAQAQLEAHAPCFFAPVDLTGPTRRVLNMVQPDVLALLETEIWPNLIVAARRRGVRIGLINGRISVRTINGYRRIKPYMRYVLGHIDAFSMISAADAARIRSLGADARRIVVNGNAKFDGADPRRGSIPVKRWATAIYGLGSETPVFVAGSTRHPEERILLDAFLQVLGRFPRTVLIIAPRHIERAARIEQWVRQSGLTCQRRSHLDGAGHRRTASVVVLDTIGELPATYSAADFVFCGGSLVPKGGQNLLEPALWEKPVMYGDSMEDFADARALIEKAGGGVTVRDAGQMAAVALRWLEYPQEAQQAGRAARAAICAHRGAARKHADVLLRLLNR